MRCFVAIELSEAIRDALGDVVRLIRSEAPSWTDAKWVRPEHLHITLKFLGELDESAARSLAAELRDSLTSMKPFDLDYAGVTAVPSARRARMLWAEFEDRSGACGSLASTVEGAALRYGVPLEERTFRPHVTLCRARRPAPVAAEVLGDANALVRTVPTSMSVVRATVLSSRLTPHGPIYSELADLPFGSA